MFIDLLAQYGFFLLKVITIVGAVLLILGSIAASAARARETHDHGELVIEKLNDQFDEYHEIIECEIFDKQELKEEEKKRKKEEKKKKRAEKKKKKKQKKKKQEKEAKKRLYVLHFDGDLEASAVDLLREEVTAILTIATEVDEVLVCVESPGGLVSHYGLGAAQLVRLRDHGLSLTVAVDRVAASGGYMMACVANHIIAAPFAIVGSIGVVLQLPNFNRLMRKHEIDYEQLTAGEYKRTITMFGENTEEGREKTQEEIEEIHVLFKHFVERYRPDLDIEEVATGEHWHGEQALDLHLIDELKTSDAYILDASKSMDVFSVKYTYKEHWTDRVALMSKALMNKLSTYIAKYTLLKR